MSMELWRCQRVFGRARAGRACHRDRAWAGKPRTGPAIHRQALPDFARGSPLPAVAPARAGGLPAGVASLPPDVRCSWDTRLRRRCRRGLPARERRAADQAGSPPSRSARARAVARGRSVSLPHWVINSDRAARCWRGRPKGKSAACGSPRVCGVPDQPASPSEMRASRGAGRSRRRGVCPQAEDPTPAGVRRDCELAASGKRAPAGSRATRRQGGRTTDHGSSVLRSSRCAHD